MVWQEVSTGRGKGTLCLFPDGQPALSHYLALSFPLALPLPCLSLITFPTDCDVITNINTAHPVGETQNQKLLLVFHLFMVTLFIDEQTKGQCS